MALCLGLVPINIWFRLGGGGAANAVLFTFLSITAAALAAKKFSASESLEWRIPNWEWAFVGPSAFFVWLWSNGFQAMLVDEDYWIHTPLVGAFSHGVFPPQNPFFPEIVLNGHYGRDLIMGCLMSTTGWDVLEAQFHCTSIYQTLLFLVTWLALRREGDFLSASVAGLFLLFGINVGWKSGLIAAFYANYPPSYLCFILTVFLLVELFRRPNYSIAMLCAIAFAAQALYFETILVALVLGSIPALWSQRKKRLAPILLAYGLGGILCLTQGGALTKVFSKSSATHLGEQTQRQTVVLTFPRKPFLTVWMVGPFPTEAARCEPNKSFHEWLMSPPYEDWGNVYILSKPFLGLHWFPIWFCPITFWFLRKESQTASKLLAWAGIASFVLPSMFHFGPVYDSEWYRWQYAAGFGLALSLGVVIGRWLGEGPVWRKVIAALIVTLNILGGIDHAKLIWTYNHLIPLGSWFAYDHDAKAYLKFHESTLGVNEVDMEAFELLKKKNSVGETILVNFDPGKKWDLLFESTLRGWTGMQPVGHAFPTAEDYVGLPPGRMKLEHFQALKTLEPEALHALGADHIYLRLGLGEVSREQIAALRKSPLFEVEFLNTSARDARTRFVLKALRGIRSLDSRCLAGSPIDFRRRTLRLCGY